VQSRKRFCTSQDNLLGNARKYTGKREQVVIEFSAPPLPCPRLDCVARFRIGGKVGGENYLGRVPKVAWY